MNMGSKYDDVYIVIMMGLWIGISGMIQISEAQMVPAMFVFGDSLVDVGNNNLLPVSVSKANFPHNGIDFPSHKPTGRYSNGKNTADFLAEKVGLPTSPPYLTLLLNNASAFMTGVSFASGGAGVFNGTDQTFEQAIPLTKQVSNFEWVVQQKLRGSQNMPLPKSLFLVVVGSNDLLDYSGDFILQQKHSPNQYVDLMASTLKSLLKRLYDKGGRKFVIAGVGPAGCIPQQRVKNSNGECNEKLNSMVVMYNGLLKSLLQELKSNLHGFSFSYFDTFDFFQSLVVNPATYGFKEVKAACCGLGRLKAEVPCLPIANYCSNRRDHLFWDPYHPSQATSSFLVDALFNGPPRYTFPINARQLITSL